MKIISASRRTDIPAWYGQWFMNRVRAGRARYRNPFGNTIHEVSLRPEDVIAFVFWTRNGIPFLEAMKELESLGYASYVQYTLTGYGTPLEHRVLGEAQGIESIKAVSDLVGPDRVRWRYDPVILGRPLTAKDHLDRFARIAAALEGRTRICHISFIQFYVKTRRHLSRLEFRENWDLSDPPDEEKIALARELRSLGRAHGIRVVSCCNPILREAGIPEGVCIDGGLIRALRPDLALDGLKVKGTRKGCHCVESREIGAYGTCQGGCLYCYATASHTLAAERYSKHDPDAELLA